MLNGIDPIIIFQLYKIPPNNAGTKILESLAPPGTDLRVALPPIPIYLSETLTGLYIESEDKTLEIHTENQTFVTGDLHKEFQKGIASTVTVNLVANKDSIGLTLMSVLCDVLFDKVTSKEYTISYLHGPTTIFNGLLQSFSITQNNENSLARIKLELTKGTTTKETTSPPAVKNNLATIPVSPTA